MHWGVDRFGEQARTMFARGDVFYDHQQRAFGSDPYVAGTRLWLFRPVPDEPSEPIMLTVQYLTDHFMVVDKPHEMATIPKASHVANSVLVAARRQFSNDEIVAAHRLDYETAGLVLLTTDAEYRGAYQKLFENRRIAKTYYAAAPMLEDLPVGQWRSIELDMAKTPGYLQISAIDDARRGVHSSEQTREWNESLPRGSAAQPERRRGATAQGESIRDVTNKEAVPRLLAENVNGNVRIELSEAVPASKPRFATTLTDYRMVAVWDDETPQASSSSLHTSAECRRFGDADGRLALYELRPRTGFTHQLRVVMAHLGVPILGDPIYPKVMPLGEVPLRPYPLQLLAARIEFGDPLSHEPVSITSHLRLAAVPQGVWGRVFHS